jgi:hypothetical protein
MNELTVKNNDKIKEYQTNLNNAKNEIKQKEKSIVDMETVVIKQEDKIEDLNKQILDLKKTIFERELSTKNNENYSMQLMTIINEQKIKIQHIRNKNIEKNNDEIIILKRQIEKLKNDNEIKDNIITNLKNGHKHLQDKYLNIFYNIRKKEQDDLLRQAKILQKYKIDRDLKKNAFRSQPISKSSSLTVFRLKNKANKINNDNRRGNSVIEGNNLPAINKSLDSKEDNKNNSDFTNVTINKGSLEKINNMMKQIIEEN